MAAQKLPIKDIARFLGRAVQTTSTAARVVANVTDALSGAGAAVSDRQLRELHDAVAQLEIDSTLLAQGLQQLIDDDSQDDARVDGLERQLNALARQVGTLEQAALRDRQRIHALEQLQVGTQLAGLDLRVRELEDYVAGLQSWTSATTEPLPGSVRLDTSAASEIPFDAPMPIQPAPRAADDDGARPEGVQ